MTIYVDAAAAPGGNGSRAFPFQRINDAAQLAQPGDEVLVAPGVYREYVDPRNAGREDARITYRSAVPLGAVITGAEEAKSWTHLDGDIWLQRIDNALFGAYNPYTTLVGGDWYFAPMVRHTGAVYLNGQALYEAASLQECRDAEIYPPAWQPEQSRRKWYTCQQDGQTLIYANFGGLDPNAEDVQINVRRNCFLPSRTGIGYLTVSGFAVTMAATTCAPPAAYQDGMIGPHWSKGWIIEDCDISFSKCCGISLGKYLDPDNEQYFFHKHVKTPTQMERDAVCRGQYHGWSKETVGSHIIRRCHIHHCEQAGIAGRMGCVFSIIEDNHIHHINTMQELGGAEVAGIKLHAAIDVILRRNHIHHCTMGIWCDWEAQGTRITANLLHDNQIPDGCAMADGAMTCQDIFVEVSHGPTLIDHNVLLSKVSVRFATQGVALVHNLLCGSLTAVGLGTDRTVSGKNQPRYTPYHIPHRTELAGFMIILHGDNRFYNNIFLPRYSQEEMNSPDMRADIWGNTACGTHVFNGYPTYEEWIAMFDLDNPNPDQFALRQAHFSHLPVWSAGNVYLGSSQPWEKETDCLVLPETFPALPAEVDLPHLRELLFSLLGGFTVKPVTAQRLGVAFEPEQAFENPDGTPVTFDTDFFGIPHHGPILPGPFASR